MGALQGFGVLDQDAVAGGDAGAGHDRRRCGQAQGARAGDHQHGDRVDQRLLQPGAGQQPAGQGEQGDADHHRHEDVADPVHQLLDRRLGRLGVFHQADDPRQHGLAAQRGGADAQHAFAVDRAAGDLVARGLGHRQAFPGDQRLVGMALAVEDFAIHRETLAGAHQYLVTQAQFGDCHIFFAAIAQASGALRAQGFEGADGGGGLPFGAAFQVFAKQDQGDDHRAGFEIQVWHGAGGGGQPEVEAQTVAGAGAEGDQQVHVAAAGFHRLPRGNIEARAEDELHRRGEKELHPGRQHPVQAEPLGEHRQHQRQGEGDG
ncbi:hypothetical protein D3C81_856970 [compost metagenome]